MPLRLRPFAALSCALLFTLACHEVHFEPKGEDGEIGIFDDLFAVTVVNDDLVLASGYWGTIYRSEDSGQSWTKSATGTKKLIYDISMADDLHGWAVGQLGLVLRTDDGGMTWQRQNTPKDDQGVQLFSVEAVSEAQAIAVGEWGTRIVTTDGGKSWRDDSLTVSEEHPQFVWLSAFDQDRIRDGQAVFEDVTLNDVHCLPSNRKYCWIIGEFAYLFRSEDGGETWENGEILSGITIDPIELAHNEVELAEEDAAQIRRFALEISDQQHLNIAVEPRVSAQEIAEFGTLEDPFPLFEIVEARTQEVQIVVEDAGILSDRIRRRGAPPWDFEDFIEDDPEFLDRYMESRLAEVPGVEVTVAQNPYLFSVRFADENEGYISGLGGVVLRTHDGGRTWTYEGIGRKQAIFSVAAVSGDKSIVVGEKGLIRASEDGGRNWTSWPGFPTLFTYMRDIAFAPGSDVGYIVGQRAMVLRTEDGGKNWTQVLPEDDGAS
jgi:photosystem II stability/assembly factor-like uncharacterized protein